LAPRKWRQPCRKRTTQPSSPVTLTIRHAHGGFALLTKDEAFLYSAEPGSAGKKLWQGCICIHPRPARSFPLMKMSCFQQQHPAGVAERTSPLALTGTKRPRLLGLDTWALFGMRSISSALGHARLRWAEASSRGFRYLLYVPKVKPQCYYANAASAPASADLN